METQRILSHSLDKTHQATLELQKLLFKLGKPEYKMPDISSKDKAQAYIGLNMKEIREKKEVFKKTMVPEWIQTARKNKRLITPEN